jgi:hypothetical protein
MSNSYPTFYRLAFATALENSDVRFFIIKAKPFEKEDPDFLDSAD